MGSRRVLHPPDLVLYRFALVLALSAPAALAQQATLAPPSVISDQQHARSVAVAGGDALVGRWDPDRSGAVQFYSLQPGGYAWAATDAFDFPEDLALYGGAVDLAGEPGSTFSAIVGASEARFDGGARTGRAFVYRDERAPPATGSGYGLDAELVPTPAPSPGDRYGFAVSIDGSTAVVASRTATVDGVANAGEAFVFVRDAAGQWSQQARLRPITPVANQLFGTTLTLEGDRVAVSALGETDPGRDKGVTYVFDRDASTGTWGQVARLTTSAGVGSSSNTLAIDDGRVLVGSSRLPASSAASEVFVFERVAGTWTETATLDPSPLYPSSSDAGEGFGLSVGAEDGVVGVSAYFENGAPNVIDRGAVYVFEWDGDSYEVRARLEPPAVANARTGIGGVDVARSPEPGAYDIVAGAFPENSSSGNAYVFQYTSTAVDAAAGPEAGAVLSAPAPNPADARARLVLSLDAPAVVRAELTDALGRSVRVLYDGLASGRVPLAVETATLAPGLYVVRVEAGGETHARRLTVVR